MDQIIHICELDSAHGQSVDCLWGKRVRESLGAGPWESGVVGVAVWPKAQKAAVLSRWCAGVSNIIERTRGLSLKT